MDKATVLLIQALFLTPWLLIALGCLVFVVRQPSVASIIALLATCGVVLFVILSTVLQGLMMYGHAEHETYIPSMQAVSYMMLASHLVFALAFIALAITSKRKDRPAAGANTVGRYM